jgi:hypothetical protein
MVSTRPPRASGESAPKEQLLYDLVVGGKTVDRLIATRRHRLQTSLLGQLDRSQQGHLAAVVEVHANAEIDLGRAGYRR